MAASFLAVAAERAAHAASLPTHAGELLIDKNMFNVDMLGSALPTRIPTSPYPIDEPSIAASRPFACAVAITVKGQSETQAVEQGAAIVHAVQASFERGRVSVSKRAGANCETHVMWRNLGAHSLRLDPSKSNRINWLDKSWSTQSELDPSCAWPTQRAMLLQDLPHAQSWVDVLQRAREDGGIDIKDDCRLEDSSARCHQDGANACKPGRQPALVRLAINVSSFASGRSLDYLQMSSNGRLVDGEERAALLVHSVSQHRIWHGAAQNIFGYVEGVSQVCHGSSAGVGPCLKRIITVFALPPAHPLAELTATQRLERIGVSVWVV